MRQWVPCVRDQSAAVYFREFIGPTCAVVVGLDIGGIWGFRTVTIGLLTSVVFSIFIALTEVAIPLDYYSWINAVDFTNLKSTSSLATMTYSALDIVDQNTTALFNFGWDSASLAAATSFRFGSSVLNPISYAYILVIAGLAAIACTDTLANRDRTFLDSNRRQRGCDPSGARSLPLHHIGNNRQRQAHLFSPGCAADALRGLRNKTESCFR